MTGTSTYNRPNNTTQSATTYKAYIDAMAKVFERTAAAFAPHAVESGSPAPDLAVVIDAGAIFNGGTLTEVAAQTVAGFTTPASGYTRIDRVVLDPTTGVASRIAGTAVAGSPSASAPDITSGAIPICQVSFTDSDTAVTNDMITDERTANPGAALLSATNLFSGATNTFNGAVNYAATSGTDTYTASLSPAITSYVTGAHYFISFGNANTSTTPTLNLNSLGAKTIVKEGTTALAAGNIPAGHKAALMYDGTYLVLMNPKDLGIDDGSITPAKLSTGAPSWDTSSRFKVGTSVGDTPVASNTTGVCIGDNSAGTATDGVIQASATGNASLFLNRKTDDGNLVLFYQDGTNEGSISVSGTTVSYNGGHLARLSQLADGTRNNSIVKGTVLSNLDQMCVWSHPTICWTENDTLPEGVSVGDVKCVAFVEENEQLNCTKVSDVVGDPNVAGVFVAWDGEDDGFNDMIIAMTGDMVIRIAAGVVVARGDLLESAGDGTAQPQGDDIVRRKTVAKVTSAHVSHVYPDESYLVPCVLMTC